MRVMRDFFRGMHYLWMGFGLIFKPGLKRFVVMPVCVNILLFVGLFFLFRHVVHEFNLWFNHFLPVWLFWLGAFIWGLFFFSFFLLFVYTFVMLGNILAAPFNSLLAEKVAYYLTGERPKPSSVFENIKAVPRVIGRQLSILGYYLSRALLILMLFWVPVVQVAAPFLWFLFNAWYMTLTYMDYPAENRQVSLTELRLWLSQRRAMSLGFGVGVIVISIIPVVNCLLVPVAVAAAVSCWLDASSGGR